MKFKKSSKWALFSLSDTSHAIKFGKKLQDFGWNIIATNETLPLLKKDKINCISINEFTEIHELEPEPLGRIYFQLYPEIEKPEYYRSPSEVKDREISAFIGLRDDLKEIQFTPPVISKKGKSDYS